MTKHGGEAKVIAPLAAAGQPVASSSTTAATSSTSTSHATQSAQAAQQQSPQPAQSQPTQTVTTSTAAPTASASAPTGSAFDNANNAAAEANAATQQAEEDAGGPGSKRFVCHICQKPFRLEAALSHHYQAKHQMEMPATAGTAQDQSTSSAATTSNSSSAASLDEQQNTTNTTKTAAITTSNQFQTAQQQQQQHQYISASDVISPQPPQYHLDAAPGAPEEYEIAVHSRCVNNVLLVGNVQDVAQGYVFENKVLQFVVVTNFQDPAPGDPDRDFHTVRVFGEELGAALAEQLRTVTNNQPRQVVVSGRLRMIPQYEPASGRYYHFPVVQVHPGSGSVFCV